VRRVGISAAPNYDIFLCLLNMTEQRLANTVPIPGGTTQIGSPGFWYVNGHQDLALAHLLSVLPSPNKTIAALGRRPAALIEPGKVIVGPWPMVRSIYCG